MSQGKGRKRRPLIGICAGYRVIQEKKVGTIEIGESYVDAVTKAGGVPVALTPTLDPALARDAVERVDALLVPGGGDIKPSRYGRRKHATHKPLHPRREDFWFHALAAADERRIPILGICLGSQVLNVGRGGTLIQDVPSQWEDPIPHRPPAGAKKRQMHHVIVEPGTLLASIVGAGRIETNSSHHQAIETPGRGLVVSAHATDGVIEAVEATDRPFYLSIQWHPEAMTNRKKHLALFEALVRAAKGGRAASPRG